MSALNVELEEKSEVMSVTAAVFQPTMLPYVVAAVTGSVTHAVAAEPMLVSVMVVSACATGMKTQLRSTAPMSRQRLTLRGNADSRGRHFGGRTWKEPASSKAAARTYILVTWSGSRSAISYAFPGHAACPISNVLQSSLEANKKRWPKHQEHRRHRK